MNCLVLTRIYRSKNSEVCYYSNDDASHLRSQFQVCVSITSILMNFLCTCWLIFALVWIILQRIEIRKLERTYLYMCYGHLPEAVFEQDSVYFMRNTEGMVALPSSMEEAAENLPALFEIGILNGHSLVMLEQVCTLKVITTFSLTYMVNSFKVTQHAA